MKVIKQRHNLTLYALILFLDNRPIFSVDIHPKGGRFATGGQGGQGGRIVIWNIAPVLSESDEDDPKIPKMLCQMDNHLGGVFVDVIFFSFSFYSLR